MRNSSKFEKLHKRSQECPDSFGQPFTLVSEQERRKLRTEARQLKESQWFREKKSKGLCERCFQHTSPEDLTLDHIVPLSRGGTNRKGNLQLLCSSCNRQKAMHTPAEEALALLSHFKEEL